MAKLKKISGLDCAGPADKMVRLVLRAQLKRMCELQDKALDWKDPEGVHDMRVLSRRLRSAVSDLKPYVPKAGLPRTKLKAIANSLGDVRDEDVALIALEELKSKAEGTAAAGIEMLAEERRKRRKDVRARLRSTIKKAALDDFRKEFLAKLRTIAIAFPNKSTAKEADDIPAFKTVGIQIIKARLKDFSVASPHLYRPFKIKDLHELRILSKRLRYAIEFFAVCWGEELAAIAKEIALLQTSLGELHDCDVWINSLGSRLKRTDRRAKSDEEILNLREGAAWLLKHFAWERMEHYRDTLTRWEQWQANGFLEGLILILDRGTDDLLPAKQTAKVQVSLNPS
jgi:CHAD domain-containing protein